MVDEPIVEAKKPVDDDNLCIDCSVLKDEVDRKKCEELTTELAKETIGLETFSNALINEITGNDEEKADKMMSVFCDANITADKEENGKKEGLVWQ